MKCLDDTATFDFLEGKLEAGAEADVKKHLDGCDDCRVLVSEIAKSMRADTQSSPRSEKGEILPRGRLMGRYHVLDVIGAGGMGVVYAAYDPELDRKVALKLLRANLDAPEGMDRVQKRLSHEAKAMARLSHENVVMVHDAGTFEGRVFVAMELVDGVSLGKRLEGRPPWQEVLSLYMSAGKGLEAAHKAGLVHRDFKPDNVLVGKDGRVRVTDFGLARPVAVPSPPASTAQALESFARLSSARIRLGSDPEIASPATPPPSSRSSAPEGETQAGVIAGTPAYMAPEQLLGKPADERSDQFSFCVALYEGVYGQGPFAGKSIDALANEIVAGRVRAAPKDSRVPAWLRRVLLRGLSAAPGDRYVSMTELLGALERRQWKLRSRVLLVAGVAITILVGLAGYRGARAERAPLCTGAAEKLGRVWGPAAKEQARRAFEASGTPYAGDAWTNGARLVDEYGRAWVAMRTDACEATRVRGEQSEDLLDLRVACLDDRLVKLGALTKLFGEADAKVVETAVFAAQSLPSLDACANAEALRSGVRPPADAATGRRVDALRVTIAEATALDRAGRYKEAFDVAGAAVATAREVKYLPAEAEAVRVLGTVQGDLGDSKAAEATLEEAAAIAEAASDHEVAARAWIDLAYFVGYEQARYDQGQRWLRYAAVAIERTGGNEELEAERVERLGLLQWAGGKNAEALGTLEQARVLFEKRLGPSHIAVAKTLDAIALVDFELGKYDVASDLQARAIAIDEQTYGPQHPVVAVLLNNRANSLSRLGRNDEALASLHRALDILDRTVGPDHEDVFLVLDSMGDVLSAVGRNDEALAMLKRARAVLERGGRTTNPDYAEVLNDLGEVSRAMHAYDEALLDHRKALAILEAAVGKDHPDVAMTHFDIGEVLFAEGKYAEAAEEDQRALPVVDDPLGGEISNIAKVLTGLGEASLEQRNTGLAVSLLERALGLREKIAGEQPDLAKTRFALARALWETGPDARPRALALAREARGTYASAAYLKVELGRVDEWLGTRDRP